jgi:hypothetical protein
MALVDRIVVAATDAELFLQLQDAGAIAMVEAQPIKQPGCVLLSWIGNAYGDDLIYALITLDDALVNIQAFDASMAGNIDPSRSPIRMRAGTVSDDPDAAARGEFRQRLLEERETQFGRFKTSGAKDKADTAAAASYAKLQALRNMTSAQVQTWVANNVTNLAQAQDAIATLAIAVSVLSRRL